MRVRESSKIDLFTQKQWKNSRHGNDYVQQRAPEKLKSLVEIGKKHIEKYENLKNGNVASLQGRYI